VQLTARELFHDLPVAEYDDPVGPVGGDAEIVGDEQQ
jgi:hypothetical protein